MRRKHDPARGERCCHFWLPRVPNASAVMVSTNRSGYVAASSAFGCSKAPTQKLTRPCFLENMCMEPPWPLQMPVFLPNSSAMISRAGTPCQHRFEYRNSAVQSGDPANIAIIIDCR